MKKLAIISIVVLLLFSCTKSTTTPSLNANTAATGGTLSLGGTKWNLYQYKDETTQNPLMRSDTLIFINATNYTWNGVASTYEITYNQYATNIRLNGSPFGNIAGNVAPDFISYGEIIDMPFNNVYGGIKYYLWIKKK